MCWRGVYLCESVDQRGNLARNNTRAPWRLESSTEQASNSSKASIVCDNACKQGRGSFVSGELGRKLPHILPSRPRILGSTSCSSTVLHCESEVRLSLAIWSNMVVSRT
jgi:hypothetical protein